MTGPVATRAGARIFASPLARRLAAEAGIDLATIEGSGPGGRIIRQDLAKASRRHSAAESKPDEAIGDQTASQPINPPVLPKRPGTHRFSRDIRLRDDEANSNWLKKHEDQQSPRLRDLAVFAAHMALQDAPKAHAAIDHEACETRPIALAVLTASGSATLEFPDIAAATLPDLSAQIRAFEHQAIAPQENTQGGLLIWDLTDRGIHQGDIAVPPGRDAVIPLAPPRRIPVVGTDGEIMAGTVMAITMNADQTAFDPATAARLTTAFCDRLEQLLSAPG